ncbi:MAG: nitroreductase family protein [Candidatus Bathyarchaeota archaeon]|nr:nitroreductase family protein [Candidatus Bathyarchaeota archaeon]
MHDAIVGRRSIRRYQPKPVPLEAVLGVLEAAGWAPSAHNSQPWRFIILQDPKVKRALAEALAEAWAADLLRDGKKPDAAIRRERVERFAEAPALVLACLTMEGLRRFPDAERQGLEHDLAVASLGAGLQNLLLAAYSAGLGGCWYCAPAFCKDKVREILQIPQSVEPQAFITLGYAAEHPSAPSRKKLTEYCFLDAWGNPLA